jgi:hypothetical protein
MDLMTGTAILMGGVGIALFNLGKVLSGCNHRAENGTGVAARAGIARTFFDEGYTGTMQRLFPGGLLARDDGGVVMTLRAGNIFDGH